MDDPNIQEEPREEPIDSGNDNLEQGSKSDAFMAVKAQDHDAVKPTDEDTDDEIWYAAQDGSFIMERRTPFFSFNLLAIAITMGIFVWMAVTITQDFIDQQDSPPTTTKMERDSSQLFPGMIICNFDPEVPMNLLYAEYSPGDEYARNITDLVTVLECPRDESFSNCLLLDGYFPAFLSEGGPNQCTGNALLDVFVDINIQNYSESIQSLGVLGFLFQPALGDKFPTAFCENIFPGCQTFASTLEDCPEDVGALSFNTFQASTSEGSVIQLKRTESQYTKNCDQTLRNWNPATETMKFNPAFLEANLGESEVPESVVAMQFYFTTPVVSKTTYNPISGQSFFGSLSGWFGFLTDGWGALSVLYFGERTFLYLRDRRRG